MSGSIENMFEPNLGVYYCDYFYWLMVIYFVLAVIQVADLGLNLATHTKKMKDFVSSDVIHRVLHIISLGVQFIIVRLFYTICFKSMTR